MRDAVSTASSRFSQNEDQRQSMLTCNLHRAADRLGLQLPSNKFWSLKTFTCDPSCDYSSRSDITIGTMSRICDFFLAKKWPGETPGMYCSNGKIKISPLEDPPGLLTDLLTGASPLSTEFHKRVRAYNCAFHMTLIGVNIIKEGQFLLSFKVQGQIYHRLGSLQPIDIASPQFLQLYFVGDYADQAARRQSLPSTNLALIRQLHELIHEINSYVRSFKYDLEIADSPEFTLVINADQRLSRQHAPRYNEHSCNEVAVLIRGEQHQDRDIVLHRQDDALQRICETHRSYDALQYPLFHTHGDDSFHLNIPQQSLSEAGSVGSKLVTCMAYYTYRYMVRDSSLNHLHLSRDLFQQHAVDNAVKIESQRLQYIRFNQAKLRAEKYIHLRDRINNDVAPGRIGQLCILPSSFTGSPRYMHERTQAAMIYVRYYGGPDLFITFTCNAR
ncbi:uncharacterized protein LOC106875985 [Octopus bimaculoides]|uniref:uncharacterized protein LOC106875985 n=1 Tax=Octopus bimaculoides TaxID=37653 RepID=UPI00071DB2DD|nr:uncharacterized protein LOC106875985 [Octopus bimaculoides]|eukprot:XP_014779813.1 PREDICTED: uncharacterized protein LOC106875985 [Octopus bimaculoides]